MQMQNKRLLSHWVEELKHIYLYIYLLAILKSPERAKFLGNHRLFCFISICNFGSFKNLFAMIISLCELYFWFRKFALLLETKVISMSYRRRKSNWKPWRGERFYFIFTMKDIHINSNSNQFTKFTSSRRCTKFKDILTWNITQMIMKTVPISIRIAISYAMKWGIIFWVWQKVNENWDNNKIRISHWRESHGRTIKSVERNPKEQDCESHSQRSQLRS